MKAAPLVLQTIGSTLVATLLNSYLALHHKIVCQAFRQTKLTLQDLVHCSDDEADNRLRRIPHAFRLAQLRIIFCQKILVEMNHWVVMSLVAGIALHQLFQVGCLEHCHEVVHHPCDALIEVVAGKVVEYLPKERIRFRNQPCRFLAAEILGRIVVQAGCKHAVGYRLRIDVGKVLTLQVLNKHHLESFILPLQIIVLITAGLIVHSRFDDVGQQTSLACHLTGKPRSRCDALNGRVAKMLNHRQKLVLGFIDAYNLIALDFRYPYAIYKRLVFIKVEVEIVGENDVVECLLVAVELFLVPLLVAAVKVGVAQILCLHKEHWQMILLPRDDIVWRATFEVSWFVGHNHLGQQALQQLLQCRPVRMFAGKARFILLVQLSNIKFQILVPHTSVSFLFLPANLQTFSVQSPQTAIFFRG